MLEEGSGIAGIRSILRGDVDEETLSHLEETIMTGESRCWFINYFNNCIKMLLTSGEKARRMSLKFSMC